MEFDTYAANFLDHESMRVCVYACMCVGVCMCVCKVGVLELISTGHDDQKRLSPHVRGSHVSVRPRGARTRSHPGHVETSGPFDQGIAPWEAIGLLRKASAQPTGDKWLLASSVLA